MKRLLRFLPVILSLTLKAQIAGSFSLNFNNNPPAGFIQSFSVAVQKWSNYLQISVPVKVNVFTVNSPLLPFSAITLANARKDFTNAPISNTLYPTSLANQLAGAETNPGEFDMDIYFNLATSYYYGTGAPSAIQRDFITTAMHEVGHGLGFYSDGYVDGTGKGSFGNVPPSALFPLTPSFPWVGNKGVPAIYDKFIVKSSGASLITIAPNNSTQLGDSIKNGAMYFSGPLYANPSHSNNPVRLAGGAGTFTLGVDLLHIHDTYANTIMSYYWGDGDTVRIPAPWELGILKEIGWNLKTIGISENNNGSFKGIYPNPANHLIHVSGTEAATIEISDLQGRIVLRNTKRNADELVIDVRSLQEGIYLLTYKTLTSTETKKIVVSHTD